MSIGAVENSEKMDDERLKVDNEKEDTAPLASFPVNVNCLFNCFEHLCRLLENVKLCLSLMGRTMHVQ